MNDKYLVETDFLFGLRPSDSLHKKILSFIAGLDRQRKSIFLSAGSLIEIPLVLYGEGKPTSIVEQTINTLKLALRSICKFDYQNMNFLDIVNALQLRNEYNCSFFDSIHISIALNNNLTLVSSDKGIIEVLKEKKGNYINILEY